MKALKELGIDCISTEIKRITESDDPLQSMAYHVIMGKAQVCRGLKGKVFNLNQECENPAYVGKCDDPILTRNDLLEKAKDFPFIVIDCSFYDFHTEKEKKKLKLQIQQCLGVIRKFMWDERLVITHKDFGVGVFYPSTAKFIKEMGLKDIILLDPNGDEVFEGQRAECYIIGGIVDKTGNKRGWTSKIGENLRREGISFRSMRIELRGDVIGVPDRLNTIVEIVLRVVLDGEDVEKAVRSVQSHLVAKWRLRRELPKRTIRIDVNGKPFRVVRKSEIKSFDWLNIRPKDFYEACSELGYLVIDDEWLERILRNSTFDESKNRYIFKGFN
ncbi:tRNA (guanine-N1)-methyltransferase [Archaeoglobus profundus]|uniref:tRNA (guanine-N1)-methyltransferase n=1 Tax=Archaeoglobus profundus TaxID=84156 RepID=UPI001FDEF897|nr:tRNA (guanine-N1)-methyltransferase [Archaeoglobus profundus]